MNLNTLTSALLLFFCIQTVAMEDTPRYTVGIRTNLAKNDDAINQYQHMTLAYLGALTEEELISVKGHIASNFREQFYVHFSGTFQLGLHKETVIACSMTKDIFTKLQSFYNQLGKKEDFMPEKPRHQVFHVAARNDLEKTLQQGGFLVEEIFIKRLGKHDPEFISLAKNTDDSADDPLFTPELSEPTSIGSGIFYSGYNI